MFLVFLLTDSYLLKCPGGEGHLSAECVYIMAKHRLLTGMIFCFASCAAIAAGGAEQTPRERAGQRGPAKTLDDFDIDLTVETVVKDMADAARNYYLPDSPASSKAISRYTKDSKKIVHYNTDFKRELAQVSIDLAKAAVDAMNPETAMLPGIPLEQPPAPLSYVEGVSSITVMQVEGYTTIYTNTMPCINATGKALERSVRVQYIPGSSKTSAAKSAYGRQVSAILTANRFFNHALAEVCAQLVRAAKAEADQNRKKE